MSESEQNERDMDAFKKAAEKSSEAGIADETAALDDAMVPTEDGAAAKDSEAHPS
ncbi:hypothetical protein SAMN05216382_1876 [Sphingomonas palmae]|uniref:Uncharacterized protein n=1 Tax=Sphingomonas palmae TaxID=1855283 RepID=A0A1H7PKL8_9SPHN|nr:hypothetical protein [Sphingomonas palmae]SEL36149.1 hypothetical protein SAMN05216382_1876 [Sphingomonas palmae]